MNVGIIGGGIIGLCSAYYFKQVRSSRHNHRQGELKTVARLAMQDDRAQSLRPFAAPGMISKGIRWMFKS